jgi:4-amino-4-deoxy-L-arabinose transferase-like glycosyltransferase
LNIQRYKFILLAIIVLAAALRFYQLGTNPPSLDWDETAEGYNAYSLLKTGRDEYGYKLPLSFRSFDDYKPPLYIYMTVPSVAVFGLNDFAVRFPSAILGVLAVLFCYFAVFELFSNRAIALLSSLFLAISPWHLQFSRVGFETNSTILWSLLGTWAFLKGTKSNGKKIAFWMSLAAIAFGLNLFMYHNSRVFIPLFTPVLIFLFKDKLLKAKKYLLIPLVIALIFSAVLLPVIFSIQGQLRYEGTTVFSDVSPLYKASDKIEVDRKKGLLAVGRILHNRRFVYVPIIVSNYLSHLSPTFLFFTADMNRHHAPGLGLLYLWDLPFILAGIYFLIKNKFDPKSKAIIFAWFLLAPVAASVTWGVPHSLRTEIYLPTFQIFTAIGVYTIYTYTKRKKLFIIVASALLVMNFAYYLHQYYIHMPQEYSKDWLYGRKQAALISDLLKSHYDRVIVSTKLEQPHEFWLYYLKYDPNKYLSEGGTISGGFLENRNHFDKFFFKPIDFNKQSTEAKTLFVGLPSEFPQNTKVLGKIDYLNGEPAIYIVSGV